MLQPVTRYTRRMDRSWSVVVWSLALLGWGVSVSTQQPSLADIARQEKERRAAIEQPATIYTNDDLVTEGRRSPAVSQRRASGRQPVLPPPNPVAHRNASSASTVTAAGSLEQGSLPSVTDSEPARDESYWRERLFGASEAQRRAAVVAAALQNRVDGLWTEFAARDDPAQRTVLEQQRREAIEWLERTRATLHHLDQEIADIHDEARRAGAPPGWLRD